MIAGLSLGIRSGLHTMSGLLAAHTYLALEHVLRRDRAETLRLVMWKGSNEEWEELIEVAKGSQLMEGVNIIRGLINGTYINLVACAYLLAKTHCDR